MAINNKLLQAMSGAVEGQAPRQTPDETSAGQFKPTFPAQTDKSFGESIVKQPLRTVGNIPSSAFNFVKNIITSPFSILKNVAEIPSEVGKLKKEVGGAKKAAIATAKEIPGATLKTLSMLAPKFLHDLAKGDIEEVERTIVNDPVGQILPIILAAQGISKLTGKETQFNKMMSDISGTVTKPIGTGVGAVTGKLKSGISAITEGTKAGVTTITGKTKAGVKDVRGKLTPIEPGVESALKKTTPKKLNKYSKQAELAKNDFSKPTPLELAGREAESALTKLFRKRNSVGKAKSKIIKDIGSRGSDKLGFTLDESLNSLKADITERLGGTLTQKGQLKSAKGRTLKILGPDKKLIRSYYKNLQTIANRKKTPTIQIIDDVIDKNQNLLFNRKKTLGLAPVNTNVEALLKGNLKLLNDSLKGVAGKRYSSLNSQYASLNDLFSQLNKALGERGKRGGSLMKRVFSPTDAGTKTMFEQIRAETGVDLITEATLAKFAMESVGDIRQASLLQRLLGTTPTPKGILKKGFGEILDRSQDPFGKAQSIIKGK